MCELVQTKDVCLIDWKSAPFLLMGALTVISCKTLYVDSLTLTFFSYMDLILSAYATFCGVRYVVNSILVFVRFMFLVRKALWKNSNWLVLSV